MFLLFLLLKFAKKIFLKASYLKLSTTFIFYKNFKKIQ